MPTIHTVIEKFPGGTNVILHKTLNKAILRFKAILSENLEPDLEDDERDKVINKAIKEKYWSTCEGDYDQEITLELASLTVEE
jgi:hypothetical protein